MAMFSELHWKPPRADKSAGGTWRPLALIHLANAAALFLPVLPTPLRGLLLRSQAERKAASASHSGEMKGEGAPLHLQVSNQA